MNKIIKKRELNDTITLMEVEAPIVARKAKPGQFIILRADETSERIPLTIAGYDKQKSTITIIFQKVGYSTRALGELKENDFILDFVGPLGKPSETQGMKNVCVIGGGLGVAIAYPQAKALHEANVNVDFIVGFRNKELIILEDEFNDSCTSLTVMTDDGSNGNKGFVTDALKEKLQSGKKYDTVIAIGPLMMMKAVCDITKEENIKTIVSMNSIMVDGTGMCGGCRLSVDGEVKFACVDGPDFDGHKVDFEEAIRRSGTYKKEEAQMNEKHLCRLTGGIR